MKQSVAVCLFVMGQLLSISASAQIVAEGEQLHIGPEIDFENYDFTLNGFKRIYWCNGEENARRTFEISLDTDNRVSIGSNAFRIDFYNPEKDVYMRTKSGWIWTDLQPPRVDPDDMPYYSARRLIMSLKPCVAAGRNSAREFSFDLSGADDDISAISDVDGNGNQYYEPLAILPYAVAAMKQIREDLLANGEDLEMLTKEFSKRGYINSHHIKSVTYDKGTLSVVMTYDIPKNGVAMIMDNAGSILKSVECERSMETVTFDMSDRPSGIYLIGLSVDGIAPEFRQFVK